MKINITTIKRERGASLDFSFSALPEKMALGEIADIFQGEILVSGKVTNLGTGLLVTGMIIANTKNSCARCLKELVRKVEVDFSEEFVSCKDETIAEDAYTYQEEFLNLQDLVVELLLVEQPIKALCQEDCKGLCPCCGVDLNISTCACDNLSINPKLLALKDYKFD